MALPRQQTLRALIDWSYDLLTEAEKTMLRRLSVFAGGMDTRFVGGSVFGRGNERREYRGVGGAGPVEQSGGQVAWWWRRYRAETTRYPLLETVRQYAQERLVESGESELVQGRHRDYFLAFAEEAEPQLAGAEQAEWLDRLEAEHENLRGGLEWSLQEGNASESSSVLWCAVAVLVDARALSEGREWCVRALETVSRSGAQSGACEGAQWGGQPGLFSGRLCLCPCLS